MGRDSRIPGKQTVRVFNVRQNAASRERSDGAATSLSKGHEPPGLLIPKL
jgi:hypothetical protein